MAKKNLKNALRAHEAKKAQVLKERKVQEAIQRKAASIKNGKTKKTKVKGSEAKEVQEHELVNQETKTSMPKPHKKAFDDQDTVLLVGEGNFSFALSLLRSPHSHSPTRVLATAFDSERSCYEKYPDAEENVKEIRKIAGRKDIVLFGIDAGDLLGHKDVQKVTKSIRSLNYPANWNKIVFNFPHVGAGHKDESRNVMANQLLLIRFLISAAPMLSQGALPISIQKQLGLATQSRNENKKKDDMEEEEVEYESEVDHESNMSDGFEEDGIEQPKKEEIVRPAPVAGSILITLRDCKPYSLWDVATLAKRLPRIWHTIVQGAPSPGKGIRMPTKEDVEKIARITGKLDDQHYAKRTERKEGNAYILWQSFAFHPTDWPGYSHRRTIGWKEGLSKAQNEEILRVNSSIEQSSPCRTWQFGLMG